MKKRTKTILWVAGGVGLLWWLSKPKDAGGTSGTAPGAGTGVGARGLDAGAPHHHHHHHGGHHFPRGFVGQAPDVIYVDNVPARCEDWCDCPAARLRT